MSDERRIISVDRLNGNTVVAYLADGTAVEVTADQLLNSGLPRIPIPPDEGSFQRALRSALDGSVEHFSSAGCKSAKDLPDVNASTEPLQEIGGDLVTGDTKVQ